MPLEAILAISITLTERSSSKLKYEVFQVGHTKSLFDMIDEWDMEDQYTSMIIAHISDIRLDEYKNFLLER